MIRRQDYFGRYGGEEFLLVLVDLNNLDAYELAERIRRLLAEKIYPIGEHQLQVTASIGLTIAAPGENLAAVIARADQALYAAKHAGRNRTELLKKSD
jgi:diguanylate cyclase (GGDEF)-like protein